MMNSTAVDKRFLTQEVARFEKYGSGEIGDLFMKNMSSSGACFKLLTRRVSFIEGDLIRVKIALDSLNTERVVNAEVRWNDGEHIGVQFILPGEVWKKLVTKQF